jgi:peptidoglycan/LPS O-acetylase OafA/YrhL
MMTLKMDGTPAGPVPMTRGGWLDLMRAVAAVLMVLHHFERAGPFALSTLHPVFERGYLLTDFFIIDSGYVLSRIYMDGVSRGRTSTTDFLRKRFLRVVPLHLIVLGGLVAAVLLAAMVGLRPNNPQFFEWSELPGQVLLVQAFGLLGGHGWNAPTWSLSALLGCYVFFPILARRLGARSGVAAVGLAAAVFVLANGLTWAVFHYPVYQMPLSIGIFRALPLFFLGMALARFSDTTPVPERLARWVGLAALVALVVAQAYGRFSIISLGLICTMIAAAGAIPVRRPSIVIEKAALASFAVFLSNEVVRILWFGVVEVLQRHLALPQSLLWAAWGGGVLAALAGGWTLYVLVDAPLQRLLSGRRAGERSRRATPATAT